MSLGIVPRFPAATLLSALDTVPASAWRQPQPGSEPTNPGYRTAPVIVSGRPRPAASVPFRFVLTEFAPVWAAWLAEVPAGGHIGPHIDQGPYHERWHVPIIVAGTFNGHAVKAGVPFQVRHWEPHWVDNPSGQARVHLVIDRDVIVDVPPAPFQRIEDA